MKKQRLIVAGNGMAGIRCIEHILKMNRDMFEIVIFGTEPHPNYNRILLSSVLQGEVSLDDITLILLIRVCPPFTSSPFRF